MRFNAFLLYVLIGAFSVGWGVSAQELEPEFREELYFSEVDRDIRSPQAVRVGGVVFVSALSAGGATLEEQLQTIYIRMQSILGNYGLRMADVAQERIYLKSGQSYEVARERRSIVYGGEAAPALALVEVSGFEDREALVSIELIAVASPDSE